MFFDDELLAVGRASNPKSNMSMGEALTKMLEMCEARIRNAKPEHKDWARKNTANYFNFVMKKLFNEGYKYFNPEKWKL